MKLAAGFRSGDTNQPFSILYRIVVGETFCLILSALAAACLSVSSIGSWWVKRAKASSHCHENILSVSSIGSWWVKPSKSVKSLSRKYSFSILYRIVVGETCVLPCFTLTYTVPFSILYRIVVGETRHPHAQQFQRRGLSVSSIGSWWVKLVIVNGFEILTKRFQYPLSDRGG